MNTTIATDFVRYDTNKACETLEYLWRKHCIRYINNKNNINKNKKRNNRLSV